MLIVRERPCGPRVKNRPIGRLRNFRLRRAIRGTVEHTEADKRRAASHRQERAQLWFKQIAGFVGEIAGKPFALTSRVLRLLQGAVETFGRIGGDDLPRLDEQRFIAGEIVAEEYEGGAFTLPLVGRVGASARRSRVREPGWGLQERYRHSKPPPRFALRSDPPHKGEGKGAQSNASSSSIRPDTTDSPLPQKAGSEASSPNGFSSSE